MSAGAERIERLEMELREARKDEWIEDLVQEYSKDHQLSEVTVRNYVSHIRPFIKWAIRCGYLSRTVPHPST